MKKFLFGAIALVVIAAGAMAFFGSIGKSGVPVAKKDVVAPKQEAATENGDDTGAGEAVDGPIKDVLGLGRKARCTYTAESGDKTDQSAAVAIDGKRFKSVVSVPGGKMYMVFDGDTQYVWTDADKNGFRIDRTCFEDVQKGLPENLRSGDFAESAGEGFNTAKDANCQLAASVDISVPTDIVFADQCALLRDSVKTLQNTP